MSNRIKRNKHAGKTGRDDMSCEKKDFRAPLHPPFAGERRAEVERQHAILREVYISDFQNYELGFRGDMNPDREIGVFRQIADGFLHLAGPEPSLARRKAIFCAILLTRMASRDAIPRQPMPMTLSKAELARIVDYMYDTYGDAIPMRFIMRGSDEHTRAQEMQERVANLN